MMLPENDPYLMKLDTLDVKKLATRIAHKRMACYTHPAIPSR